MTTSLTRHVRGGCSACHFGFRWPVLSRNLFSVWLDWRSICSCLRTPADAADSSCHTAHGPVPTASRIIRPPVPVLPYYMSFRCSSAWQDSACLGYFSKVNKTRRCDASTAVLLCRHQYPRSITLAYPSHSHQETCEDTRHRSVTPFLRASLER